MEIIKSKYSHISFWKGKKLSEEHRKKLSLAKLGKYNGEKNPQWKGGKVKAQERHRPKEIETSKLYRIKNKEKIREYNKIYKDNHKELYSFLRRQHLYRKKNADGIHTLGDWETLKAQYNYTCLSCHKSEPEIKLTEDHIIPLSRGGSNNIENIQPLCASCNSSKHTKIINFINNNGTSN